MITDGPSPRATVAEPADRLPFGKAPQPDTGDEFIERIGRLVRAELPTDATVEVVGHADLDAPAGIVADLALRALRVPVDLAALVAEDASIPVAPAETAPTRAPGEEPTVVARSPGVLRHGRCRMRDAMIATVPVEGELELACIDFDWAETSDGALLLGRIRPAADDDFGVRARAAAPLAALVDVLRAIADLACRRLHLRLRTLDLELEQPGPTRFEARAHVRVGRGPFSAGVRATASARIEGAPYVLQLDRLRISSANPLVAIPLLALRARIAALAPRSFPLEPAEAEGTRPDDGVRLTDLEIRVGERLEVRAALGRVSGQANPAT